MYTSMTVVENTLKSSGVIESKLLIRSITQSRARGRAKNMAFLHNGLAPMLERKNSISAEITEVKEVEDVFGGYMWEVQVRIEGIN